MLNLFGQEIDDGHYVGLGVRAGNVTELRAGRVLSVDVEKAQAHTLWYDDEKPNKVWESKIDFNKLWLIDGDTLSARIKRHLDLQYNERNSSV